MTPRRLHDLLRTASAAPPAGRRPADRAAAVWQCIRQGWDPERIEWQRWLRRWWPWVLATVVAVALTISFLPHGKHTASNPPPLGLFGETDAPPPAPQP